MIKYQVFTEGKICEVEADGYAVTDDGLLDLFTNAVGNDGVKFELTVATFKEWSGVVRTLRASQP